MTEKEVLKYFEEVDKLLALQEPNKALEIVEKVKKELKDNQKWLLGRAYFWEQLCYKQTLDIEKGENAGNEAVKIFRALGDNIQTANVIKDTASLFEHIGNYGPALELLEKALFEIQDQKVLQTLGIILAKKAKILAELRDFRSAEPLLLAAENIVDCTDSLMHRLTVATHLMELYVKMREFDRALKYSNKAENLLNLLKDEKGYLNEVRYSQIELSRSFIAQGKGQYKEAIMRFRNFLKFGLRPKKT